jgi:UDP-N-acetylglucosamine--N-acetylmuramyl-(pentapeptide) pyrophosphoryl-undecaprenol N-acetylglucosamine transferase
MKLLFTGGGTMGPVTPLLAVNEALKKIDPAVETIWIGTPHGPERAVVEAQGIQFFDLPVARFPRGVSVEWILFPLRFFCALVKAAQIMRTEKPHAVGSAGGYTAVPVVLAAKIFGVPVWVHSQDAAITLTTRLTAPWADRLTVAWKKNVKSLGSRAHLVGNPVRESLRSGSASRARERFGLDEKRPTLVVFGGGTGARWLNEILEEIIDALLKMANVIHITGAGKKLHAHVREHYAVREFLKEEMADALAVADLVVCRAGMGTITELAAFSKAAIVIPLPASAQEQNVQAVADACVVLFQASTTSGGLKRTIEELLADPERRRGLGEKMHRVLRTDVADELAMMLLNLQKKNDPGREAVPKLDEIVLNGLSSPTRRR